MLLAISVVVLEREEKLKLGRGSIFNFRKIVAPINPKNNKLLKAIFSILTSSGNSLSSNTAIVRMPAIAPRAKIIFKIKLFPAHEKFMIVKIIATGIKDFQNGLSNPEFSKATTEHANEK